MNFTTTFLTILLFSMSSCSSNEKSTLNISQDTPSPKSSLADLTKNQSNDVPTWDGRIKGCKSKQ